MKRVFLILLFVLLLFSCFALAVSADEPAVDPASEEAAASEEWTADDTSLYTQIRSTILHYLFGDDTSNVPFGTGWVDLLSTLICMFVFMAPIFICFVGFKWVARI